VVTAVLDYREKEAGPDADSARQRPALTLEAPARPRRSAARAEALSSVAWYLEVTLLNGQNYSIPV
jgi:hypothetical protein